MKNKFKEYVLNIEYQSQEKARYMWYDLSNFIDSNDYLDFCKQWQLYLDKNLDIETFSDIIDKLFNKYKL